IRRQPRDAEIEGAAVGNIRKAKRQGVAMGQQTFPIRPAFMFGTATSRSLTIRADSSGFTDGCSEGSLRNQRCQAKAHTTPIIPKATKTARHPKRPLKASAIMGVR